MARVLIIEDSADIAELIKHYLDRAGYDTVVHGSGRDGLVAARQSPPDLVILDVMLPGMDGMQVCQALRAEPSTATIPILMLTARDTIDDRVRGLDAGADDYLIKPFAFQELLARLRALARRPPVVQDLTLRMENLTLDTRTHQASRDAQLIELSAREYCLLELLMRHPGQVLTRTQIAEHIWGYDFDANSNIVDVYIRYLRRKVDDPFEPKLIQTVRGVGYKLEANNV